MLELATALSRSKVCWVTGYSTTAVRCILLILLALAPSIAHGAPLPEARDLLVPCFDPIVMTVSQEVVKNAYLEAGRPDAFHKENLYFLTDRQFSYVASVCGIMVSERHAANFISGYLHAE